MLARIHSFVLVGIDAIACEVEADVSQRGLGKVTLVGLPQAAVKESVERGNLRIDPRSHVATLDGVTMELSPKEFALLYFLARNSGQVFSREALLDRVWGRDAFVSARTVDVHVRWLRTRIETDPTTPQRLLTVRGVGYKFAG